MNNVSHTIAAIEIGSSKINGLVAEVSGDGRSIKVLCAHSQPIFDSVRHGRIQNIVDVANDFNIVLRKLENAPGVAPRKLTGVYLGLSGRSLCSVDASSSVQFPAYMEVSSSTLDNLCRDARFGLAPDKVIIDMLPKRFILDGSETKKVIGSMGNRLKAEYAALTCSPVLKNNIDCLKIEDNRSLDRHYIVTPLAVADLVLSDEEKQIGSLMVDFGAQTITMAAYKNRALQWLKTLPFGSRSITVDLMHALNLTEDRAREIKHQIGTADVAGGEDAPQLAEIRDCTAARVSEIIANINNIANSGEVKLADLPGGIVLAGKGSMLKNFDAILAKQTKAKVRLADVDGIVSVVGLHAPSYDYIDVLAIAMAAADGEPVDCLSSIAPGANPVQDRVREESERLARTHGGGARRNVNEDDDDLLDDDDDDDDYRPKKSKTTKNREKRQSRGGFFSRFMGRERDEEDYDDEDADTDRETDPETGEVDDPYKSKLGAYKKKFFDFLGSEPKEDLNE